MIIYQLTEEDIERSSTLNKSDIGKWCYFACGCHQGFFDTKEQLDSLLVALDYPNHLRGRVYA